ncbi:MAG TPA: 4Fe-4S dicluster domain-containing protein [Thermodesulfatator atlanticus]|uniref:4Fe-4S dicluster domain-containing protein n=1 Tax=Thermodesulfatator atlanticus TaxID=501497 RepID=A0A7V5U3B2_9BACT|nr:4Fe-4S dicluster domain-containing protein [Thermodesulfatator atlanticus]
MAYTVEHDFKKCDGCLSCVEACGKAHHFPPGVANCRIMKFEVVEEGEKKPRFAYVVCMQCRKPRCVDVCPTAAMRREGDVVIIDEARCVGCLNCIFVCPWGIPVFNEATGKVSKCDLCVARVKAGQKPYCVEACPNGALAVKEVKVGMKKPKKVPTKKFAAAATPPKGGASATPTPPKKAGSAPAQPPSGK